MKTYHCLSCGKDSQSEYPTCRHCGSTKVEAIAELPEDQGTAAEIPEAAAPGSLETSPHKTVHRGAGIDRQTVLDHINFVDYYTREVPSMKWNGPQGLGICPFHDDHNPSFSVNPDDGLFNCFGCGAKGSIFDFRMKRYGEDFPTALAVLAAEEGISATATRQKPQKKIKAVYDYTDESGTLLFQSVRYEPKDFKQRRPDGTGGWIWSLLDVTKKQYAVRLVPYRLLEILKADLVLICEGEKDVHNVEALGFTATTNAMGALKWKKEYNEFFKGKSIVILPDHDEPGIKHGQSVAEALHVITESLKVIELPGLDGSQGKKDVSDWMAAGGTREQLEGLIAEAPEWQPDTVKDPQATDTETPDPWENQIYTLADAYRERPPLEYLVEGLLVRPSLNILYGAPGSLKSMLLADCLTCVAGGIPWLDRKVIQAPTMWADWDNGPRRSHERFEALAQSRPLPDKTAFYYVSMPVPWLDARNLRDIERMVKRVNDLGVKLLAIDNLGLISGGADENGHEMIGVMGNLRYLAEQAEIAVVLIHHQRKGNSTGTRAGDSLRGHSSIEGAIDLALCVERDEHSNIITIKSTKSRDVDIHPFGGEWRYRHREGTKELAKAWFMPYEIEDVTSEQAIENAILETVKGKPLLNKTQLVDEAKRGLQAGVNHIRRTIDKLEKSGRLVANGSKRGAKLYTIE